MTATQSGESTQHPTDERPAPPVPSGLGLGLGEEAERDLRGRVAVLTLAQKVRLLTGADFWSLHAEPAIGLRRIVTSDGPAGVRGEIWDERDPSANIPSATSLAATWDEDRIERIGGLLAAEARRKHVDVLLAPTVNMHRSPYGGRHFECLSEDPLLTARIGAAYVRGVQDGGVAATVKHFVGNDSETQRFTYDARIGETALRELYLEPFRVIVTEAGAWAVMAAYNKVNGATMTENALLDEVLKGEWGFDGVVVSDWYATRGTVESGRAGLDLAMPGPGSPWGHALVAAVESGAVSEAAVDANVLRLLRLPPRVGALAGYPARPCRELTPAHTAHELRSAAAAGFVLLRNDGAALPADPSALTSVALIGPNAAVARTLGGGSATVFPPYTVSAVEGIAEALGTGVTISHAPGVWATDRVPPAPLDLVRTPAGDPGVEVRFLAADGTVLAAEHRTVTAFNWLSRFTPELPIGRVAAVEVHAVVTASTDGTYQLGASGIGSYRIDVAGKTLFDGSVELPPGADVVEALSKPPQRTFGVDLVAGQEVPYLLHYRLIRPQEWLDEDGSVAFQVSAARPYLGDDAEIERAVALAAGADLAVVIVGTTEEVESEGFDRSSLALPGRQDELVRRIAAANPRTVAVVNSGAPVLLPWADEVPAVLATWFPGQEFGHALADVLFGATEPGGRLPVSWPANEDELPSTTPDESGALEYGEGLLFGYRSGRPAQFAFGHGLGYTSWAYEHAEASVLEAGGVSVTVRLRNTGSRRGREVIQVYATGPGSALDRPVRWLAGFAGVEVGAGDAVDVTIAIPSRAFQRWEDGRFAVTPGPYLIEVGPSSAALPLTVPVEVPSGLL
ncbi:MAG: beta-glucosidase [Cryptosporangiaceae bacterium]|nr:beta-glucosidase [Cryptosporangiaceae bacterium]